MRHRDILAISFLLVVLGFWPSTSTVGAEIQLLSAELNIRNLKSGPYVVLKLKNNTDQTVCIAEHATGAMGEIFWPVLEIRAVDGAEIPHNVGIPDLALYKYVHIEPGESALITGSISRVYQFRWGKHRYRARYFLPAYQFASVCGDAPSDITTDWVEFEYHKKRPRFPW